MRSLPTPGAVLDYWIGPSAHDHFAADQLHKRWFIKSADTDAFILKNFGPTLDAMLDHLALDWADAGPRQRLAAIIVMDQFSRNIHRGTARAFGFDPLALSLSKAALENGEDQQLTEVERSFLLLPLEHSEDLSDQAESVAQFERLVADSRPSFRPLMTRSLDYAHQHREIIMKFGRFPHRNRILGRVNTPAEAEYLSKPGAGF